MPGHNEHQYNYIFSAEYLSNISNGNTQNGDGTGNKLGVMTDAINSNTITGNGKLDTINTTLGTLSTAALQRGGLPSALSSDNLKVSFYMNM